MDYLQVAAEWSSWSGRLVINHLWQATLFSFLALVATRLLARGPARARYLIWLAAALKFALPPALVVLLLTGIGVNPQSWFGSARQTSPALNYVTPLVSPIVIPAASVQASTEPRSTRSSTTVVITEPRAGRPGLIMGLVWVAGFAFLLLRWRKRSRAVSHAIRAGRQQRSGKEREALDEVVSWLRIRRRVELVITPQIREPGVWRSLRPIVLLPEEIIGQLTDEELTSLMLHEMAHVLRWDNLVSNLNMILCCCFWFNPIVWLIDRSLLKEREEACDEAVVKWSGARETYLSGIKKIYRLCLSSGVTGLSAAGGSNLRRRLERIASVTVADKLCLTHRFLILAVVLGSVALSLVAGLTNTDTVVARTNGALKQAGQIVEQVVTPASGRDCGDGAKKICAQPAVTTVSEGTLGAVVVRVDSEAQLRAGDPPPQTLSGDDAVLRSAALAASVASEPPEFQTAHAVDLRKFVGRYGVDPATMENFVLDISLDDGDLWLKPSHAEKRRLIARSAVEYQDSKSPSNRITFTLDTAGNVQRLTLRGGGETMIADRLVLPRPSLEGTVTFKLRAFPDARVVAVAGSFNGWNQSQYLFSQIGGEWVCRINLPAGTYQYKFIVDGDWLVDPSNAKTIRDDRGIQNSLLVVQ